MASLPAIYGVPPPTSVPPMSGVPSMLPRRDSPVMPPSAAQAYGMSAEPKVSMPIPLNAETPPQGQPYQFTPGKPYGRNPYFVHPEVTPKEVVDNLFKAITNVESKGDYKALNPDSGASGRFQYLDRTWNNYGGYKRAMDAPPEIQDKRMREDFINRLTRYNGDPFKTVAEHLNPISANKPELWEQPIRNEHGQVIPNRPTVSQYLGSVLGPDKVKAYLQRHVKAKSSS